MGGIKTISIIVAANIKGLEASLGKANKSITSFASNAARVGSTLTFGITAPLAALGKSALDTFVNFEAGMAKVQAVTGATAEEFKLLEQNARDLGKTTRFTAQEFADLQLVLGRKGFNPQAIVDMTGAVSKLAIATGEDLSLAADVVSSSINAFNLEATDAKDVANTLASASANSSIQLSTFATAFGHAGTAANAVGVDINELAAMMGVLMDNGIKASKAGTGLRTAFSKLNEEGIPFSHTLSQLANGTMSLNDATELVGRTGANQLLILANQQDKVNELTQSFRNNTDELDKMSAIMEDTTEHKIKLMNSAIEGMKEEIGGLLADALTPMIEKITDLASEFSNLDDGTKNLIIQFGAFAALLGPLLLSLSLLSAAFIPIKGVFSFFAKTIGPIVVPGIVSLTTAVVRLTKAGFIANGMIGAMTGAFRALTAAMIANPVTAVVVGVLALGSAIFAFTRDTDDATEANNKFNKSLGETKVLTEQQAKALNSFPTPFLSKGAADEPTSRAKVSGISLDSVSQVSSVGSEDPLTALIDTRQQQIEDLAARIQQLKQPLEDFATGVAITFTDSFGDMLVSGELSITKLGNIFKDLIKQIAAAVVKAAVLAGILTALGLAPAGAAKATGFSGGGFGSSFASILMGGFRGSSGIQGFANGGKPPIGRMSLVGEKGPELFVPNQAGTIIPNGGFGQNITVTGFLSSEGIQIAALQGQQTATQKGADLIGGTFRNTPF